MNPDTIGDEISPAQMRDPASFQKVYNRYSKPILAFICHMLGDRSRAEELTQETFARAYFRIQSVQGHSAFSTWIFGIARNVVREAVRKKYRDSARVALDEPATRELSDGGPGPEQRLMDGELNRAVQRALTSLPEDQRTVFVLKVLAQMRYAEIAEITGHSVGKLKTDLHRARIELRRKLGRYMGAECAGRGES